MELRAGPFNGHIEVWGKWASTPLNLDSQTLLIVEKQRWLRKFDTCGIKSREIPLDSFEQPCEFEKLPAEGCNVEFTRIRLPKGQGWFTFGFEAFGSSKTVESSLCVVAELLNERKPPKITNAFLASYPKWLASLLPAPA